MLRRSWTTNLNNGETDPKTSHDTRSNVYEDFTERLALGILLGSSVCILKEICLTLAYCGIVPTPGDADEGCSNTKHHTHSKGVQHCVSLVHLGLFLLRGVNSLSIEVYGAVHVPSTHSADANKTEDLDSGGDIADDCEYPRGEGRKVGTNSYDMVTSIRWHTGYVSVKGAHTLWCGNR